MPTAAPQLELVQQIKHKILVEREIRVKDLLFNTSTWTGAALYKDWSAAPWDTVGSDVITHVLTAKEKVRSNCGMNPDSMLIGASTMAI